jgi:hypothetical protein
MRGPAPKQEPRSRPNDEARKRATFVQVAADGVIRGPELPNSFAWHPRTVEWWQTWRESAQAQRFLPTDWDVLLETAVLHSAFWSGDPSVAAELRLRVAKFGATMEDRMRLRIEATGDDGSKPKLKPAAARSTARKARLLKAVGDG